MAFPNKNSTNSITSLEDNITPDTHDLHQNPGSISHSLEITEKSPAEKICGESEHLKKENTNFNSNSHHNQHHNNLHFNFNHFHKPDHQSQNENESFPKNHLKHEDGTDHILRNGDLPANEVILMEDDFSEDVGVHYKKNSEGEKHNSIETTHKNIVEISKDLTRCNTIDSKKEISDQNIESIDQEQQQQEDQQQEFKFDSGYAWVILAAGTMINSFSWGASGSFGVFLANFLESSKYGNATRIDFAFVGGLQFGIGLMISPFITYLLQRVRYTLIITIGSFVQAGAYIAASFATKMWHLYLAQGVLNGISIGLVFVPANAAIPQWFSKRRGMANGVFTSGAGLGSIIFSLSVQSLIDSVGIAWAQRYVGLFTFGVCLLSGVFIKERKGLFKRKLKAYNFELLKRSDIWLAIVWGTITMLCYGIVLYTMAPFAVSIGLSHQKASILSAVVSVGIIVGRPILGHLADTIGSINAALFSTIMSSLFIFAWWIPGKSYSSLIGLSLFLGSVVSSFSVGFPPICASIVELEDLGAMLSMSWAIIGALNIFSTPIAIALTTINGSYLYSQIFTGAMFTIASIILIITRGIQFRIAENKEAQQNSENFECVDTLHKTSFLKKMFQLSKV